MKRIFMILLGVSLVLTMTGAVLAADVTNYNTYNSVSDSSTGMLPAVSSEGGSEVQVSYTVARERYTLQYPGEIVFDHNGGVTPVTGTVTLSDVTLASDRKIEVKVLSDNDYQIVSEDGNYALNYTMEWTDNAGSITHTPDDSNDGKEFTVLSITTDELAASSTASKQGSMTFTLNEGPKTLGNYQDTLHFRVHTSTITS